MSPPEEHTHGYIGGLLGRPATKTIQMSSTPACQPSPIVGAPLGLGIIRIRKTQHYREDKLAFGNRNSSQISNNRQSRPILSDMTRMKAPVWRQSRSCQHFNFPLSCRLCRYWMWLFSIKTSRPQSGGPLTPGIEHDLKRFNTPPAKLHQIRGLSYKNIYSPTMMYSTNIPQFIARIIS